MAKYDGFCLTLPGKRFIITALFPALEEMNVKNQKKIAIAALAAVLAAAVVWVLACYHVVGFRLYPKNADLLDLRGQTVSLEDYEVLREKMPGTEIRWDVPFQGGLVKDDTRELELETLSAEDVVLLDYLTALEVVKGQACGDYANLAALQQRRPEVRVEYEMSIGGKTYDEGTRRLEVDAITAEELAAVPYLPALEAVVVTAGGDGSRLDDLRNWCLDQGVGFYVVLGGQEVPGDARTVEAAAVTDAELELLALLPDLREMTLREPAASPEALAALEETYPHADICWEVEICGNTYSHDTVEVDLSQTVVEDLAEVEARMAYLPKAEKLILGLCGLDDIYWGNSKAKNIVANELENEEVAAFRDRVRDRYKVVWTVRLGPDIALRTDADDFMPGHFGIGRLFTSHAYNLRYCEDMVCLDVGHMTLSDVSFLEFMPKLKYLILAHTEVQNIEPIRHCKELVFLELDWSCVRDYGPLVGCTALEDLNIGKTHCDITPVLEMTWLKNLWMIEGSARAAYQASQALPDTRVVASGAVTVGSGWRKLPNYYAMRDALGMYYMD